MTTSVKSDLKCNSLNYLIILLLYIESILLLGHAQIANQPVKPHKSAVLGILDSANLEISMKSQDIIHFITGVDSLPEYLHTDLHIRILCSMLSSIDSKFSKVSRTVTKEDSVKYYELFHRLLGLSDWKKDLLKYKYSHDYSQDIIDHIYLASTPYNFKVKGDKIRSIKKMFIARGYLSKKECKRISRQDLITKIVNIFERYQFGNYTSPLYSKLIYERVSVMNKIYGNPRVDFSYQFDSTMWYGKRAYYEPGNNIMYLGIHPQKSIKDYLEDWIAELAHSAQYYKIYPEEIMHQRDSNEIVYVDSILCKDNIWENDLGYNQRLRSNSILGKLSEWSIRDKMHEKKETINGFQTIEYEAHKIIEPKLKREYFTSLRRNILH